jgi:hypothetical protein
MHIITRFLQQVNNELKFVVLIVFWDDYMVLLKMEATGSSETMVTFYLSRAVVQAVSRWLPTEAARVRVWAAFGVCGGQSGTGVDFIQVLRFPLPNIPPRSASS